MHVAHSSQRFHQRAERQARYRGYDILMQRRDLCWVVTVKPSRPELPVFQQQALDTTGQSCKQEARFGVPYSFRCSIIV